ncbi:MULTISPECIES: hypothetical protein [Enterococcus]|uniref:Uncharacterized protein n=1 Tax=Candidatus Enterococcus murrayae TaxID=2815321 RepID=A0ABS3HGY0_9ENTE|nr:hypothetical protein [Enterococcus sp. MJM16]MBO0452705.1 hypothetical protein [Enterococcus sp. MJM16]
MKDKTKNKWEHPKSRFHHQSGKKNDRQKDSAVRSLLFKLLSVFVIGFITKKLNQRKR